MSASLRVTGVDVGVDGHEICHGIDLEVRPGETHVLFGPNGSGKSTLLSAIMGLPPYEVSAGSISLGEEPITDKPVDERARLGLAMAFQRPPSLHGISLTLLAESLGAADTLDRHADDLDLSAFLHRDVNDGFSGGEVKRWEILKLALQRPSFCLFDEPESGVDLEHIAAVGRSIDQLLNESPDQPRSALIITHTGFILDYLKADVGHLMVDGRLVYTGDAYSLFAHIQSNGYTVPTEPIEQRGPNRGPRYTSYR